MLTNGMVVITFVVPGETVNGVTVQVHSTQVTFGNSVIAKLQMTELKKFITMSALKRNMAIDGRI